MTKINRWAMFQPDDLSRLESALDNLVETKRACLETELRGLTHDYTPIERAAIREEISELNSLLDDLDYQRKYSPYETKED
jgi:hypothetical protein